MSETHLPRLYEELSGLAFRRAAKFSESRMTCNEETKQLPWLLLECDLRLWNRLLLHFTVSSLVQWNFDHLCMAGWSYQCYQLVHHFHSFRRDPIPWTVFSRSYHILVMRSFVTCHGSSFRDADGCNGGFLQPSSQVGRHCLCCGSWFQHANISAFLVFTWQVTFRCWCLFRRDFLRANKKVAGHFWTFPNFCFEKINSNHMKLTKMDTENGPPVLFCIPAVFRVVCLVGRYTTSSPYAFRRLLPGTKTLSHFFFGGERYTSKWQMLRTPRTDDGKKLLKQTVLEAKKLMDHSLVTWIGWQPRLPGSTRHT